jgi:hypothetical protein
MRNKMKRVKRLQLNEVISVKEIKVTLIAATQISEFFLRLIFDKLCILSSS